MITSNCRRYENIVEEVMIVVDISKLKGKIVEKEMTIPELSAEIGIDKATLYRKLKENGNTFSIKEVNAIVKALGLSKEEAVSIFFNEKIA